MDRNCAFYMVVLGFVVTACTHTPPADDGFVACNIANRIDNYVEWRTDCCDERVVDYIQSAVSTELSAESAIQIALLNNPKIQIFFEEIGIARADLIEAGLLSNPVFEIEVRFPHVKSLKTNIEYLLTTSLLDIFLIPLRTKLAATQFEQAKLKVSKEILNLAFEVKETFFELIAERERLQFIQSVVELTSISTEITSKQIAIGNINTLEFQLAQSRFLEAELELSQSQGEIIRLKEKLNRLLGFQCDANLILPQNLPDRLDYQGFDLCTLESIALHERLDIQFARFEIRRLCHMLGLKEWWTYTKLNAGLAGERELEGTNVLGPGFSGELPIFNYGQAARLRLFAELRQAQNRLAYLEIQIRSEVREAHHLLMSYLKIINDYRNYLLPMQGKILTSSEDLYNIMGLGIDKLLETKRLEIVANKNYIENIKKYLIARVELDRALGGYLYKLLQRECR